MDAVAVQHETIALDREKDVRDSILALLADGELHTHAAVMKHCAGVGTGMLWKVLSTLISSQQIVERPASEDPKRNAYRLATDVDRARFPEVRTLAVPAFDPRALQQKVASILRTGLTYSLLEIVRNASLSQPHATTQTVTEALQALITAGQARYIPVGAFGRYQGVDVAQSA